MSQCAKAGVIHEDVQPAERRASPVQRCLTHRRIRHVSDHGFRRASGRHDFRDGGPQRFFAAGQQHHA